MGLDELLAHGEKPLTTGRKLWFYSRAALFEGSQLPSRQEAVEEHQNLPKHSLFKANVIFGFAEAGAFLFAQQHARDIAGLWPVEFGDRLYQTAVYGASAVTELHAWGLFANAAARTTYYLASGKICQTFYGARAIIAFSDKALKLVGVDVLAVGHKARTGLYDALDSNGSLQWLNTPIGYKRRTPVGT